MFLSLYFYWGRVFNLRVHPCFWIICHPFSHKNFITFSEEIRALSFSHIIDPMSFKMISASFSKHSITTPLPHKPHTLINITIGINHSTLSMWFTIHPHAIIPITSFKEHSTSTFLLIIFPIPSILPSQFTLRITYPESALSMPFILIPSTLIFIPILIVLYSKPILLIIFPVSNIFMWAYPFIRFLRSILI